MRKKIKMYISLGLEKNDDFPSLQKDKKSAHQG